MPRSKSRRLGIQVNFALMFAVIALTILMASVLIGLNFANWLVAPIRRLMSAANIVSTGDLHVQVPVHRSEGDLAQLGETFNKMTQELRTQRDELVNASDLIDSRRRFIEAVLSSASAGIIGVDASGSVGILNRSAEKLIGHAESETLDHPLSDVLPELDDMMKTAREGTQRLVQGQITISRDGHERNLSVRVSAEQTSQSRDSYIITLDDITELVSAQRTSAWGDVARRIAHEIKNPLTPIQLSAERIRRKFGKVITEDKAIFEQCTDTIVRQVDDIRRMVDEFSRFARMPKPVIEGEDVADTVRQAVFLMRVGHPDIDIEAEIKDEPMRAQFDRRLISQALTNIIKNATEAIEAVPAEELGKGRLMSSPRAITTTSSSTSSITVSACQRLAGRGCWNPMSRRAKRAPALGLRSSAACWKTMAAGSSCTMRRIFARARAEPGCGCGLPSRAMRPQAEAKEPARRNKTAGIRNRRSHPTRPTTKQKSKPQQATDKTGVTHGK